jgi:hypothetical protein
MRPPVLDRIERGANPAGNGSRKAHSGRRPRGPKDRPTLRLWEFATWRARMRAWCNEIKARLLRQEHDPDQPQTYRVTQSVGCPIDSPSTWLSWWEGKAVPRPRHISAAELIAPGSSKLLELTEMQTALCRHLIALDVINTQFRITGRPSDYRREQTERLLVGLNEAWISFLDTAPPRRTNRFSLISQVGESAETLLGGCELAPEQVFWAQKFGGNFARWALPSEAVSEHSWLEPLSIFRFLSMLAVCDSLTHPRLMEMWAVDLASATLVIRTLIEIADLRRPRFTAIRMGHSGGMHLMTTAAFFAPRLVLDYPEALNMARNVYGDQAEMALTNLRAARDTYYSAFTTLGISETALRALNGTHWDKTWDGAFSAPRAKI